MWSYCDIYKLIRNIAAHHSVLFSSTLLDGPCIALFGMPNYCLVGCEPKTKTHFGAYKIEDIDLDP